MNTLPATSDDRIVWDTWLAVYRLPVLTVADEVGTFVALAEQAMTTAELAQKLDVNARALQIHLGMLAAMGFVEKRDAHWRASAATRTWLHPQAEGYYGPAIVMFRSQPLHAQLLATLRPELAANNHVSAAKEWELGEMSPDLAKRITAYMNAHSRAAAKAVAMQPVFADAKNVLDVGGGSAIFAIELARTHPALQATVMEIAAVCHEADGYIAAAALQRRVDSKAVNMFTQQWPGGHDIHFLSNIFHDWSDATCRLLAQKSFAALPAGGKIVLHETLLDDDGCGPLAATAFSMLMLLGTKGRQYTFPELKGFLEGAGFVEAEALTTGAGYYSLVIAKKP